MKAQSYIEIASDAFAPRTEEQRFRIYAREGDDLTLLATTGTAAGIGTTLIELDEDERRAGRRGLIDRGTIGLLDCIESRWILLPWQRNEKPLTFGREVPIPA